MDSRYWLSRESKRESDSRIRAGFASLQIVPFNNIEENPFVPDNSYITQAYPENLSILESDEDSHNCFITKAFPVLFVFPVIE